MFDVEEGVLQENTLAYLIEVVIKLGESVRHQAVTESECGGGKSVYDGRINE